MRRRPFLLASLLVLSLPILAAAQEKSRSPSEPSETQDVVTMDQMRTLVPSLVELGWDNFFLNTQLLNSLGEYTPSPDQVRKLLFLQHTFLEERERASGRLTEAELALYQDMNGDQVSARRIETRMNALIVLESKLVSLRLQYLLRAINVFDHEQHRRLAALPVPAFNPLIRPQSPVPPAAPRVWRPLGKIQLAQ